MAYVAARAIILIQADDPRIGLVPVGMSDISFLQDPPRPDPPGTTSTRVRTSATSKFGGAPPTASSSERASCRLRILEPYPPATRPLSAVGARPLQDCYPQLSRWVSACRPVAFHRDFAVVSGLMLWSQTRQRGFGFPLILQRHIDDEKRVCNGNGVSNGLHR